MNYVESLLYTFNLSTDNAIGITEIKPVEDYAVNINQKSSKKDLESIDSNIFYIPLSLTLKGRKEGIIDFFTYTQSVGNISIEDSDLKVYSDASFAKRIPGPNPDNVFQNQIFDIESILMKDYIDSDSSQVEGDFVQYIKEKQGRDEMSLDVVLRFYIK